MMNGLFCKLLCFFSLIVLLTSCSSVSRSEHVTQSADLHEVKLKRHFLGNNVGTDMSSLINETKLIADQLRADGEIEKANRFDSYVDVLMFGNNTIDESINDVIKLVNDQEVSSSETDSPEECGRNVSLFGGSSSEKKPAPSGKCEGCRRSSLFGNTFKGFF